MKKLRIGLMVLFILVSIPLAVSAMESTNVTTITGGVQPEIEITIDPQGVAIPLAVNQVNTNRTVLTLNSTSNYQVKVWDSDGVGTNPGHMWNSTDSVELIQALEVNCTEKDAGTRHKGTPNPACDGNFYPDGTYQTISATSQGGAQLYASGDQCKMSQFYAGFRQAVEYGDPINTYRIQLTFVAGNT